MRLLPPCLCLVLMLLVAGCTTEPPPSTTPTPLQRHLVGTNRLNEKEIGGFVRQMRDVARNGTGFGRFRYVNPAHGNATELAVPAEPASVGTSHWGFVDPNGVRMVRQMREAALEGGGFVTYMTNHRLNLLGLWEKHLYVPMAGQDWFVGSGIYTA